MHGDIGIVIAASWRLRRAFFGNPSDFEETVEKVSDGIEEVYFR